MSNEKFALLQDNQEFMETSNQPSGQAISEIIDMSFEPTPISEVHSNVRAVDKLDSLLPGLMRNCDDYIEALSKLATKPDIRSRLESPNSFSSRVLSLASRTPSNTSTTDRKLPAQPLPEQSLRSLDRAANTDADSDTNVKIHAYQHERWVERYDDLVQFHRLAGHCNVPYSYNEDPRLGQWVKRQRHQYKLLAQGLHSNLTQERIQALDLLGFIWDSHGAAWDEKYQELKTFQKRHGHCNVPCVYLCSSKLSTWIKRQRRQYRLYKARMQSTMDEERIAKLEDLGLVWDYYGAQGNIK